MANDNKQWSGRDIVIRTIRWAQQNLTGTNSPSESFEKYSDEELEKMRDEIVEKQQQEIKENRNKGE